MSEDKDQICRRTIKYKSEFDEPLPSYDVSAATLEIDRPPIFLKRPLDKKIDAAPSNPWSTSPSNPIHPSTDAGVKRISTIGNLNISSNRQNRNYVDRPDVVPGRVYAGTSHQVMGQCLIGIAPDVSKTFRLCDPSKFRDICEQ